MSPMWSGCVSEADRKGCNLNRGVHYRNVVRFGWTDGGRYYSLFFLVGAVGGFGRKISDSGSLGEKSEEIVGK